MENSTQPKSKVESATEAEIPELINVHWSVFNGELMEAVFPQTQTVRTWFQRDYEKNVGPPQHEGDEPETIVKVIRNADGSPIALAIWRVMKEGSDETYRSWRTRWSPFDDIPDMSDEKMAGFLDPMEKAHKYLMGDRGHLFLEVLGTLDAYRNQGVGRAMVQWGNDYADQLGIECYLDASAVGRPVYEKNGYVGQDVSAVLEKPFSLPMIRPKQAVQLV